MSGSHPDEGHHDTMAFGSGKRSTSPARSWVAAGAVGLVVGLAAGLVVGRVTGLGETSGSTPRASSPAGSPIVADIHRETTGGDDGPEFTLLLLNRGQEPVTVTDFAFADLRGELVKKVGELSLTPGLWRDLRFSAPPDCFTGVAEELTSVKLSLSGAEGSSELTVPLPEAAEAVLQYQRAICDATPVTQEDQLIGVWILEEPYSLFSEGRGIHLVRFEPDGRFAADPEGLLLASRERGVEGTYELRDGRLIMLVDGGYACTPGDRAVWRAGMLDNWGLSIPDEGPRLSMAWLRGACPDDGNGSVWILRRVLDGIAGEPG